ncbi:MAG: right-handed parallel beta-helix repeat-containing protein, partial [Saprospiraceae bacterium]|nr:right-handed parallel beta-helix repeat-containing protein [Saprospiraceae bacterium]
MKLKIFIPLLALFITSVFAVTLNAAVINVIGNVYDGSGEEDQGPWVSGNTYIVQSAPNIPANTTLTIAPGVVVKFQVVVSFTINGKLVAQGTDAERITFTSNNTDPQPGNWYSLYFATTANSGTVLEYCDIKYAGASPVTGSIYFNATGDRVEVKNCTVDFSLNDGIVVSGASNPKIIDCTISNCRYGIYWSTSLAGSLNGCTITGCDQGLYLNATVKPRYCTITNNNIGVYVASSSPDLGTLVEPGYNTIKNNSQWNYYNYTGLIKYAIGNDWGLNNRDAIDATIYDKTIENAAKGEVYFEPFLGPLWSDVNYATANVNGKKLARETGSDKMHLAYQRKGKICYSYSDATGANWMSAVELADPGFAWGPCIALDAAAQPCIAYPTAKESYTTGLQFARFDGANWQFAPVIPQTHMVGGFNVSPPSMTIDASNNVHLTVETAQGTADGYWWFLKYYKFDASNPSAPAEIVVLDQMFVMTEPYLKSPSIALDPTGMCHIAYTKRQITINPGDVYY